MFGCLLDLLVVVFGFKPWVLCLLYGVIILRFCFAFVDGVLIACVLISADGLIGDLI